MADPLLLLSVTGLMAQVPAALIAWRERPERAGVLFWSTLAVAFAGAGAVLSVKLGQGWNGGFAVALWLSVAITLLLHGLVVLLQPVAVRLTPLLLPYLLLLAALAVVWDVAAGVAPVAPPAWAWFWVHIAAGLVTYALTTLAAVAGLGVELQERALKRRRPDGATARLPTVADGERLEFRLLAWAFAVLGAGIASGMALEWNETGRLLIGDHKTLLSLAAFAVIGLVLLLAAQRGLRGRRAARVVLVAWLLLTLAYTGVKFVTDILLA
jgi:ABC-type uncharacterized transport system permease subunit